MVGRNRPCLLQNQVVFTDTKKPCRPRPYTTKLILSSFWNGVGWLNHSSSWYRIPNSTVSWVLTYLTQWFFWWWNFAILSKISWEKEYSVINSLVFLKKNHHKTKIKETCKKNHHNCQLSYFQYSQIWLNILMDDCHLIATSQNLGREGGNDLTSLTQWS